MTNVITTISKITVKPFSSVSDASRAILDAKSMTDAVRGKACELYAQTLLFMAANGMNRQTFWERYAAENGLTKDGVPLGQGSKETRATAAGAAWNSFTVYAAQARTGGDKVPVIENGKLQLIQAESKANAQAKALAGTGSAEYAPEPEKVEPTKTEEGPQTPEPVKTGEGPQTPEPAKTKGPDEESSNIPDAQAVKLHANVLHELFGVQDNLGSIQTELAKCKTAIDYLLKFYSSDMTLENILPSK